MQGGGVAKRQSIPALRLDLEYQFDRFLDPKLARAYQFLAPDQVRALPHPQEKLHEPAGRPVCACLLPATEENQTIASQTDALIQYARTHGYHVPPEWRF